jgi:hypothetical protein
MATVTREEYLNCHPRGSRRPNAYDEPLFRERERKRGPVSSLAQNDRRKRS